jgi:hypothetical protein
MVDPMNQGRRGYIFDLMPNSVRNQAVFENVTTATEWRGAGTGLFLSDGEGRDLVRERFSQLGNNELR